jgi:glycine cleavage system H protein
MNIPADLKYTPSHEWVRVEADGTLTVGITHHAQDLLGDMVFIETPPPAARWPRARNARWSNR